MEDIWADFGFDPLPVGGGGVIGGWVEKIIFPNDPAVRQVQT